MSFVDFLVRIIYVTVIVVALKLLGRLVAVFIINRKEKVNIPRYNKNTQDSFGQDISCFQYFFSDVCCMEDGNQIFSIDMIPFTINGEEFYSRGLSHGAVKGINKKSKKK